MPAKSWSMLPAQRWTWLVVASGTLATLAALLPFVLVDGTGPSTHVSVRGEQVLLHGYGPYRHMPADVAVQGLAQDLVTLLVGVPVLFAACAWARRGSRAAHLTLAGATAYLFVQYVLYLAMATYNELFLLWVAIAGLTFQLLVRLLLAFPPARFVPERRGTGARRFVGVFLLVNGALIALLWLSVVVPPLVGGTLYPAGLAHLTTLVVQGFDLALFLPPSLLAGFWYLKGRPAGELLAPVYAVFLTLQMSALLAKIVWMSRTGASAGPALVLIPLLLAGAATAGFLSLRPHRGARLEGV